MPRGRPPYQPTSKDRKSVITMTVAGIPQDRIAAALEMNKETLIKYFRKELDTALDEANNSIAGSLYRRAMDDNHPGCTASAIFWLKCRARWKDTSGLDVTSDGKPLGRFVMNVYPNGKPDRDEPA